jgi:hypothetical protein
MNTIFLSPHFKAKFLTFFIHKFSVTVVNHQMTEIQGSKGLRGEGGDIYQSHTMFQTTKHTSFHLSQTSILPIFINVYGEKTLSQLLGIGYPNIFKTSNE